MFVNAIAIVDTLFILLQENDEGLKGILTRHSIMYMPVKKSPTISLVHF